MNTIFTQVEQPITIGILTFEVAPKDCAIGENIQLWPLMDLWTRSRKEAEEFLSKAKPMDEIFAVKNMEDGKLFFTNLSIVAINSDKVTVHEPEDNVIYHIKVKDMRQCFGFLDMGIKQKEFCGFFATKEDLFAVMTKFINKDTVLDD